MVARRMPGVFAGIEDCSVSTPILDPSDTARIAAQALELSHAGCVHSSRSAEVGAPVRLFKRIWRAMRAGNP
jgi:hypothetical protein